MGSTCCSAVAEDADDRTVHSRTIPSTRRRRCGLRAPETGFCFEGRGVNLLIDPTTGEPRWNAAETRHGPKEDFALEAAKLLSAGTMTLERLRQDIIKAANFEWRSQGKSGSLFTLNDVEAFIGKSAKGWFFEMQRVAARPGFLDQLIEQEGRGLTALARKAGPVQAQRRKGFAGKGPDILIKELIEILTVARRTAVANPQLSKSLRQECAADLAKYRNLLERERGK